MPHSYSSLTLMSYIGWVEFTDISKVVFNNILDH